jgi:endo-1,4-beta-D-glucanase Y
MKTPNLTKIMSGLVLASCAFTTLQAFAEIIVEDLNLTNRERVSRTDFRYEFDVTVRNTGENAQHIFASVSSNNEASDVSQTDLSLRSLDADDQALMSGKLVIVQNRRVRFNPADLVWSFSYDEVTDLNEFEQTYAADSAYITDQFTNHFVERGIATQEEVIQKIQSSYAQFFELIDAPSVIDPIETGGIIAFNDDFSTLSGQWNAYADNGTSPSVSLSLQDEKLVVSPTWNAPGDAIALKFQQFTPTDFSNGATISYLMEVAESYSLDGNMAVQLILEDENYTPAFFAYRPLSTAGELNISVDGVGPDFDFGYVGPGFDFTKVAGVGFQFLANDKSADVSGDILIDDVRIVTPIPAPAPVIEFKDELDQGIANWNVQLDNGTEPDVALSNENNELVISPIWQSENDAFTVKYQQFAPVDITNGVTVNIDVKLPQSFIDHGDMAIQLVVEDINYQPGYTGYATIAGRPSDEFFTLTFENIGPDAGYGYISPDFVYEQLSGIGLQFSSNGTPIDLIEAITVDNLEILSPQGEIVSVPSDGNTSVLFAASEDMAFIKAIETGLIYSEGMSYGMMLAVMMDDKETFDKLWKFTTTYMQNPDGAQKDFFAWQLSGQAPYQRLDENPAPDGEEYFAMSLFFAHNRWGSTEGIFDYQQQANDILHDMIYTQTETTRLMMHPEYKQVEFVTTIFAESFTDASYHLPAFYELWALWAQEDNEYWHEVAQVSREFFDKAHHPVTGLFSDYSTHDGEPKVTSFNPNSHKSAFDSHRVIGNIAMDYHWFSKSDSLKDIVDKQVNFIESEFDTFGNFIAVYEVDGTREPGINFRGEGRNAMQGYGATASDLAFADEMLRSLWEQNLPTGEFRYYDGFLYMFSLMHAGGEFKIHKPSEEAE